MRDLQPIKVSEWINIVNYEENKTFLLAWYQFLKALQFRLKFVYDASELERIQTYVLDAFYRCRFETDEAFYQGFFECLPAVKAHLGIL